MKKSRFIGGLSRMNMNSVDRYGDKYLQPCRMIYTPQSLPFRSQPCVSAANSVSQ